MKGGNCLGTVKRWHIINHSKISKTHKHLDFKVDVYVLPTVTDCSISLKDSSNKEMKGMGICRGLGGLNKKKDTLNVTILLKCSTDEVIKEAKM